MHGLNFHRNLVRFTAQSLLAIGGALLLALAGCSAVPDHAGEREQVRAIQHNNAMAAAAPAPARAAALRHGTADLGEDGYRAIRYAMVKTSPTPSDAARLPYGSSKVLMRFLNDQRYRRYGPTLVKLIGMIGGEEELAFLRDYLENEHNGGVDEYTYRTLMAVPEAIGYLAIHNDHAYAALRDYLRLQFWRENIAWRFAAKDRDMNAYRLVMASLDGLAIAGRPAAAEYVRFMIDHQSSEASGRDGRTRTLMDERLEVRARDTIASLEMAN